MFLSPIIFLAYFPKNLIRIHIFFWRNILSHIITMTNI